MSREPEIPVNATQACEKLGWGNQRMSAVKRAMGITGRYFFLSEVLKFQRAHPNFKTSDIYPRKTAANGQTPSRETLRTIHHS